MKSEKRIKLPENDFNNKKTINLKDFKILETIGSGSYGKVKLCKNKEGPEEFYALKMLKKTEILKHKQVDHIFSEFKILSKINHPFIVNYNGMISSDPKLLYFLLEYIPGGELFTILRTSVTFPIEQTRFYTAQIVTIFQYLHSIDIVYRDLKPENLIINSQGYLKLTDFGFAKVVEGKTYTLCGTPEYIAPEIILNKGHSKPVDWWTLGILIYEMLVGIDPFFHSDPMMIYQNIIKGKVKFPKGIDSDAKSLIKHLLLADITKRYGCLKPGVKDIIEHRFFKGFDWRALLFMKIVPSYIPTLKGKDDTSNFYSYPDSDTEVPNLNPENDPFLCW